MDHLGRILPRHERRTNHIYLAAENDVFPPHAEWNEQTTIINDDQQLYDAILKIRRLSKLKNPGSGKRVLDNILRSTQLNLAFVKIDLTKWVNENPADVRDIFSSEYVILREDSISDNNLSEFLSIFSNTAPMAQPQIVILPNSTASSMEHRLRFSSAGIDFSWLVSKDKKIEVPRIAPSTIDEFTGLFDRRCFEAVARVEAKQIEQWSRDTSSVSSLAVRLAHIRACILTAERAQVQSQIDLLLKDIDGMTEAGLTSDTEPYLLVRSLALLQKAYCSEDPRFVHEALAISSTLKHELGVAMCLRYAHFLDVNPALECHMLKQAEEVFFRNDCLDLALYCTNNRLLSRFSVDHESSDEFKDLLEQIQARTPTVHRRGDVEYNVGVEYLFANRLQDAYQAFSSIDNSIVHPIVVASAMLGKLACERLDGGKLKFDDGFQLLDFIQSKIAPSNRWHISNLILNTLILYRHQPTHFSVLLEKGSPSIKLGSDLDVRDTLQENRLMATALGLDNFSSRHVIGGRFGRFFNQTGMAMPYFFIWS
jgi:hypothetical protein